MKDKISVKLNFIIIVKIKVKVKVMTYLKVERSEAEWEMMKSISTNIKHMQLPTVT